MNEPTVTIKMTRSELILLNQMIDSHINDLNEMFKDTGEGERVSPAKLLLYKNLSEIEERLDEKIRESVNDQRIDKESSNGQTEGQSSERVCIPCDD